MTTAASQLRNLEAITAQINHATGRWQDAQDAADQTARGAKEIAERMSISIDTVRSYVRTVYEKLHVHSRTEAVVKYLRG